MTAVGSTTSLITTASITYSKPAKPAVVVRLLVMVVSLEGGCSKAPAASVESVREAYTREGGYFDFWRQCSYSWMVGDRAALKVRGGRASPLRTAFAVRGDNHIT